MAAPTNETTAGSLTPAAPHQQPCWRFVSVLFVAGFVLRFGLLLLTKDIATGPEGPASNDDVEFNHLAQSLLAGDGYRNAAGLETSFRAPGFPFFLAGVYGVCGVNYPLAYVVFCLLGAANGVLAYFLARELVQERLARAAGVLTAVYLGNLTVSLNFISENLFIPLLTLGAWLFVRYLRHGSLAALAAAGLILGYATLTRPFSLLLLPIWGLLLCWHLRRDWGRLFVAGAVYGLFFLAPILPWTYRNYEVHGHFVLITTNGGSTFLGGNNDVVLENRRFWGYWISTSDLKEERKLIDAAPNEYEHDQVEWRLGKEWVRNNPGKAALASVLKFASLWIRPPEFTIGEDNFYLLRSVLYYPLLLLIGLAFLRTLGNGALRQSAWMALHLVILASVVSAMIFAGLARFRDANVTLLMIYAVVGWDLLRTRFRAVQAPG